MTHPGRHGPSLTADGRQRERGLGAKGQATKQREREADRRNIEAEEWERAADQRDADADERDRAADQRDADADKRDRAADQRDADADKRDRAADQRDADADKRDRKLLQESATARLHARLETMPVIEQAKGMIMEQSGCTAEEAFDMLRKASQRSNVPVRELAARIVAGQRPPKLGPRPHDPR